MWIAVGWKRSGPQSSFQRESKLSNRIPVPITLCFFWHYQRILRHQLDVLQLSLMTRSTWILVSSRRLELSASHRAASTAPPSPTSATPGGHLCFWPTSYRSEVPIAPSLDPVCFRAAHRETLYWLDWLIIKGPNSITAEWERCPEQLYGKGQGAPLSSGMPQSPRVAMHSPTWRPSHTCLLGLYGGFVTDTWLCGSQGNIHLHYTPAPGEKGTVGLKVPAPYSQGLVPCRSYLGAFLTSHH